MSFENEFIAWFGHLLTQGLRQHISLWAWYAELQWGGSNPLRSKITTFEYYFYGRSLIKSTSKPGPFNSRPFSFQRK